MTVAAINHEVEALLQLLSRLTSHQLAIAVTQRPNLSSIIAHALRDLAAASICDFSATSSSSSHIQQQGAIIADLARKLISRGDPSLVNKLLPRSSLVDLALCTDAKDVLARLIDNTGANECIRAAAVTFEGSSAREGQEKNGERLARVSRAAQVLAKIASSMPFQQLAEEKLTKGQRERADEECALLCKTIANIRVAYDGLCATATLPVFRVKVSLLDAAWYLSERLVVGAAKSASRGPATTGDDLLTSLCGTNSMQTGSTPLVDLPLAVDLALVRPLANRIRTNSRSYSSHSLGVLESRAKSLSSHQGFGLEVADLGAAWQQVVSSVQSSRIEEQIPSGLVDTILAVMPDLASDRAGLVKRLRRPQYAGKDTETIIQTLFDEEDEFAVENTAPEVDEDVEALRILQERANIFDEQPLEAAMVTRGKGRERETERLDLSSGLSDEMRAAILARAEQTDSDEENAWNPFSEAVLEVGFEEEMDEEHGSASKSAPRRSVDAEDEDEDEDEDEGKEGEMEEGQAAGKSRAAGLEGAAQESSKVAAERAAERILISTWSEKGETFFTKDARKAAARGELKTKLNSLPGKTWDDGLIESWATMFARNPRKEKLLAAVDDIMLLGNQNLASASETLPGFGINRGRGGRVLRTQGEGGARGARGRGRGRGSSRGGNRGGAKRGRGSA